MGGALHRATRFLRMYNIDNRVERVLSKEKPTPAPRYPTDTKNLETGNAEGINYHLFVNPKLFLFFLYS